MRDNQRSVSRPSRQLASGALFGLLIAASIFFFLPLTLYIGNHGEFTVSFSTLILTYWQLPIFLVALLALIAMMLPRAPYLAYSSLLAMLSILIWIQGNMLVWEYGLFNGTGIDWAANKWRGWIEVGIWAVALIASVIAYRGLRRPLLQLAIALFVLQSCLFVYNLTRYAPELSKAQQRADAREATLNNVLTFSSRKNILHIVADGFQSDIFAELINEGSRGQYFRESLDGFTFFPEHMGVFPYTHMTIPAMLSGKLYHNEMLLADFMEASVGGDTILSTAMQHGYRVDLIVPRGGLVNIYKRSDHSNLFPVNNRIHPSPKDLAAQDAARIIDLALFRASPHFIKRYIYNEQRWFIQSMLIDRGLASSRFFSHMSFLQRFTDDMTSDYSGPVYKLIHLMLSHNPMVTTEQCTYAGRTLPTVRQTVKNQARCALYQLVELFERMKELGIYEDATIILMGDHGAWVPPRRETAVRNADGEIVSLINPQVMALSVPLLAVKRPGETGPFQINHAPTWIVDTAATIADISGWQDNFNGISVFALDEAAPRKRQFYFYMYKRSEWTADYLTPIKKYIIDGSVFDSASWHYRSTYYPGGDVRAAPDD